MSYLFSEVLMDIPDYRLKLKSFHESASNGNLPTDQAILKLWLRNNNIDLPDAARMLLGRVVQTGVNFTLGLHDYSVLEGQQESLEINQAVREAISEYQDYEPRTFDDGKDKIDYGAFQDYIPDMVRCASEAIKEHFKDVNQISGEFPQYFNEPKIDVPVLFYQDYSGGGKQLDLKCHAPIKNPPKKDGTFTWRVPKVKTEPLDSWVKQQAVYWKATGQKPALLSVTATDYNIIDEKNCEQMQDDYLQNAYDEIVHSWIVFMNLLKDSNGDWKHITSRVKLNYSDILQRYGIEIAQKSKQLWSIT